MLTKTITYKDFLGNERTEDFLFHLSAAELAEMELSTEGGMERMLNTIVKTQNTPALVKIFKELILRAYGEVSPDGKRFIKGEEMRTAFEQSEAYSTLFMELVADSNKAAEFFKKIVPENLGDKVKNSAQPAITVNN